MLSKIHKRAKTEHEEELWKSREDRNKAYETLVTLCSYVNETTDQFISETARVDSNERDINRPWDEFSRLLTRVNGMLTVLGFDFPVGGEMLEMIKSYVRGTEDIPIGGKHSANSSLIITAPDHVEQTKILKAIKKVRDSHTERFKDELPLSTMSAMYIASRDGPESNGLVIEKGF